MKYEMREAFDLLYKMKIDLPFEIFEEV